MRQTLNFQMTAKERVPSDGRDFYRLKNNTTYTLNFKTRGKRIDSGSATVALLGVSEVSAAQVQRKERGVAIVRNEKKEEVLITQDFTGGATWAPHSKTFTVNFKDKENKAQPAPKYAVLEFRAILAPFEGEADIADVSIVEAKK